MPAITPANMNVFFTACNTLFWNAYASAPVWWDKIASLIPSTTEINLYGWEGRVDKLQLWAGPRKRHEPYVSTYQVQNRPYERIISIDQYKILDDQYGIYFPTVANLGLSARKWPDYMLRDLICNLGEFATTALQLGTDGVAHWNGTHYPNPKDTSIGSSYSTDYGAGYDLTPAHYATVWQDFCARQNEVGEPLGVRPTHLVVPPALNFTGKSIVDATFLALKAAYGMTDNVGSAENLLRGSSDLIMIPELIGAATWYLLDCGQAVKPFIFQQREAPVVLPRIQPTDPSVYESHTFEYSVTARGSVGWCHPWLSCRAGV